MITDIMETGKNVAEKGREILMDNIKGIRDNKGIIGGSTNMIKNSVNKGLSLLNDTGGNIKDVTEDISGDGGKLISQTEKFVEGISKGVSDTKDKLKGTLLG